MRVRIVLVEPEYEINLGSVARAMENFGARELWLVRPKAGLGFLAKMFAKHAWPLLKNARQAKSLETAVRGCSFVAGTTGAPRRYWRSIKNCVTPRGLAEIVSERGGAGAKGASRGGEVALVFGSEGRGLGLDDLKKCDAIVNIPAGAKYPVLNLSHAVAVVLYELNAGTRDGKPLYRPAAKGKVERLARMFKETVSVLPAVRDKEKVSRAFSQVVARARPGDDEAQALFAALSGMRKLFTRRVRR
ncbi:MAG: RNA methyltransferase [Candidatus Micrarchaeota archaeon]|nr:RNA methyltransferase [Candidatus Micrarchaeota archaeon]